MLEDNYKHKGMRRRLVDELMDLGISQPEVIKALLTVPRHIFFETAFLKQAYQNKAFPIGENQTISQPFTVAYQSEMLAVKEGDKILEIGTGSGYQAAILASMGAQVYTIERHKKLHLKAKQALSYLRYNNVHCLFGDGFKGAPAFAPYDKIIVTAAAPYVPDDLIDQLRIGGIMVIPVDEEGKNRQQMLRITKESADKLTYERGYLFSFVPMLKGKKDLK